jgi:hypothetical protein
VGLQNLADLQNLAERTAQAISLTGTNILIQLCLALAQHMKEGCIFVPGNVAIADLDSRADRFILSTGSYKFLPASCR